MTTACDIIENLLSGQLGPLAAADEAAWHAHWQEQKFGARAPADMALAAGAVADRLAWVFVAGYQAAIRKVVPHLPDDGWAAFVATEHKAEANIYPPTTLRDGILEGCKSWVAQSRQVSHLLVTVNGGDGRASCGHLVHVDADQPGVNLSHREAPGFLADMSQGFARFEAVRIAPDRVYPGALARPFSQSEPVFVMLAGAAFLLARSAIPGGLGERLASLVLALHALSTAEGVPALTLERLDAIWQQCLADYAGTEACRAQSDWAADGRLLGMYASGIKRRVQRAAQA
jgi:acyl-CoA dehydrogenase